jgi:hypothetical protein
VLDENGVKRDDYRGAYIAPLLKQAKSIAWDYLKKYAGVIPGVKFNESELRCDLPNGARITLWGADNPDGMRGLFFDDVVLDEVAQMPPRLWSQVVRPTISDRLGRALFVGTPQGHNFFYKQWQRAISGDPEWLGAMYKVSETRLIAFAELESARKDMSDEEYEQEYECSFTAAILGAYYGKQMETAMAEKRIGRVPWEPMVPVHTAWDLGVSDSTVIWFWQQVGREIRVIDHYEMSGMGLDHYIQHCHSKPYTYGTHWAPHDIRVRELSSGKSRLELARALGISFSVVPDVGIADGINNVRLMLPRVWFDAEKCSYGLECLRQYRKEWDDRLQLFKPKPLHDWTSHSSDGFRYLALAANSHAIDAIHRGGGGTAIDYNPLNGYGHEQPTKTDYNPLGGTPT